MLKIKNTKQEADTWVGMVIQPDEYYIIQNVELLRWQNDSKVLTDLGSGNLVLNNDNVDVADVATAINVLKGISTEPRDADGAIILRQKAAQAGWKAQFHAIRLSTATVSGIHNKDRNGNDLGFCTYTMYDAEDQITTVPAECVKTVVTWEPTHDMEIVGGRCFQRQAPSTDVWMYVTAAAHIPAQYGGSIEFLQGGMNLKDVADGGEVDFDGRAAKFVAYDATYHSGRFEILLKHDAGVQHSFSLVFELFKP